MQTELRQIKVQARTNKLASDLTVLQNGNPISSTPSPTEAFTVESLVLFPVPGSATFGATAQGQSATPVQGTVIDVAETCVSAVTTYDPRRRVLRINTPQVVDQDLVVEIQAFGLPAGAVIQVWNNGQQIGTAMPWADYWLAQGSIGPGFETPNGVSLYLFRIARGSVSSLSLFTRVVGVQNDQIYNMPIQFVAADLAWSSVAEVHKFFNGVAYDGLFGTLNRPFTSANIVPGSNLPPGLSVVKDGLNVRLKGTSVETSDNRIRVQAIEGDSMALSPDVRVWTQDPMTLTVPALEFEVWGPFSLVIGLITGNADTVAFTSTDNLGALSLATFSGAGYRQQVVLSGNATETKEYRIKYRIRNTSFIAQQADSAEIIIKAKSTATVTMLTTEYEVAEKVTGEKIELFRWTKVPAEGIITDVWVDPSTPLGQGSQISLSEYEAFLQLGVADTSTLGTKTYLIWARTQDGGSHGPFALKVDVRALRVLGTNQVQLYTGNTVGLPALAAQFRSYWPLTIDASTVPSYVKPRIEALDNSEYYLYLDAVGGLTPSPIGSNMASVTVVNSKGNKLEAQFRTNVVQGFRFNKIEVANQLINKDIDVLILTTSDQTFSFDASTVPAGFIVEQRGTSLYLKGNVPAPGPRTLTIDVGAGPSLNTPTTINWNFTVSADLVFDLVPALETSRTIDGYVGEPIDMKIGEASVDVTLVSSTVPQGFQLRLVNNKELWMKGVLTTNSTARQDLAFEVRATQYPTLNVQIDDLELVNKGYRGVVLNKTSVAVTLNQLVTNQLLTFATSQRPGKTMTAAVVAGDIPPYTSVTLIYSSALDEYNVYLVGHTPRPGTFNATVEISDGVTSSRFTLTTTVTYDVKSTDGPTNLQRGTATTVRRGSYERINTVAAGANATSAVKVNDFVANIVLNVPANWMYANWDWAYSINGTSTTLKSPVTGDPTFTATVLSTPIWVHNHAVWVPAATVVSPVLPTVAAGQRAAYKIEKIADTEYGYRLSLQLVMPVPQPSTPVRQMTLNPVIVSGTNQLVPPVQVEGFYQGPSTLVPQDATAVAGQQFVLKVGTLNSPLNEDKLVVSLVLAVPNVTVSMGPRKDDGSIDIMASGAIQQPANLALKVVEQWAGGDTELRANARISV